MPDSAGNPTVGEPGFVDPSTPGEPVEPANPDPATPAPTDGGTPENPTQPGDGGVSPTTGGDTTSGSQPGGDTPADPPAPVTHTLGDDLKAIEDAKAQSKADADDVDAKTQALADAQDKAKASAAKVVDLNTKFAGDIKSSGDAFRINPDGTATAFYNSTTAPEGYTTEILKPIDTVVPDAAPTA